MSNGTTFETMAAPAADPFEDAPIALHELDAEGVIRRVNSAECALLGYGKAEMIGRPIWDFIAGEEVPAGRLALSRKLAGVQPLVPFLRQYVRKDCRYITVEIRDQLLVDETGQATGIRSALIDVTDRVKSEGALLASEQWLKAILRSLDIAVLATDSLGAVKVLNPAAESVTGWPESEAVGMDIDDVVQFHRGTAGEVGERLLLGSLLGAIVVQPWRCLGWIRSRTGAEAPAALVSAPILHSGRQVVGVAFTLRRRCPRRQEAQCVPGFGELQQ